MDVHCFSTKMLVSMFYTLCLSVYIEFVKLYFFLSVILIYIFVIMCFNVL